MKDAQAIDRFFTEQVVGRGLTVTMGPSAGRRTEPSRGVLVDALSGVAELSALSARSAWAGDPADVVAGHPVSLPGLARWRRGLLLGGLAAWSALLAGAVWWAAR